MEMESVRSITRLETQKEGGFQVSQIRPINSMIISEKGAKNLVIRQASWLYKEKIPMVSSTIPELSGNKQAYKGIISSVDYLR